MYASHDSFTGHRPRRWYMWLLQPFSKTQNLTIEQQIAEGVRVFDLRVRFDGLKPIACHSVRPIGCISSSTSCCSALAER